MEWGTDQRQQLRFPISRDEGATGLIDLAPTRQVVEIADLSLGGAGLVLPRPEILDGTPQFQLGLHWPDWSGETPVDVVHVRHGVNGVAPQVGVRFRRQGEDFLRDLCRYLVRSHSNNLLRPSSFQGSTLVTTTDKRRLRRTLLHCCRQQARLRLYELNGALVGAFYPTAFGSACLSGAVGLLPGERLRPGMTYDLVLHSFNSLYRFRVPLVEQRGIEASFRLPDEMAWGATRFHARVATGVDYPVWLEFIHPQIPGKALRKCAREVGFGGASFPLDVEEDMIAPGTVIESALLRLPSGHSVACRCVIRHTYREPSGSYACGLQILDFVGGAREVWVEQILRRLNPEVRAATAADLEEVWQVLERSGYLEEKPLKAGESLRDDYMRVWSALTTTPTTRCWVHRQDGYALGTVSSSPLYSKSCLIHHLGVDREQDAELKLVVLGNLVYRTLLQWLTGRHPETNLVAYFDAERPFNKVAWFDFLDAFRGMSQLDKREVNVIDCSTASDALVRLARSCRSWVRKATPSDIECVSADLLERDGPFVHDAFDYHPSKFALERNFDAAGATLQRKRHLFVVGSPDQPLSYAICESSTLGANIFSLYDTCRIVIHDGHAADHVAIRDELFCAAAEYYRNLGCSGFLVVQARGDAEPPAECTAYLAKAIRAVVGPDLFPRWAEYLNEVWTHMTESAKHRGPVHSPRTHRLEQRIPGGASPHVTAVLASSRP